MIKIKYFFFKNLDSSAVLIKDEKRCKFNINLFDGLSLVVINTYISRSCRETSGRVVLYDCRRKKGTQILYKYFFSFRFTRNLKKISTETDTESNGTENIKQIFL